MTPMATMTPLAGGISATPVGTAVSGGGDDADCFERIERGGTLRSAWSAACVTSNSPDNQTYYSRFYEFGLLGPGVVSVTLYSSEASPYLYLMEGVGGRGRVCSPKRAKSTRIPRLLAWN